MSDGTSDHAASYPKLPEWVHVERASPRVNALMRQNWGVINQAADLLNDGDMTPLAWAQLQDLWAETIDLDTKYEATRITEFDREGDA